MTKIYQPQSSIVLHHSSCRVAPVLVSAHPVEGSGYHQCMHTSYRLEMSKSFLAPEFQLECPFQHAVASNFTTPLLSQARSKNCPVLDSQEAHKSSWDGTARRCTGIRTKRHRSFKVSLQLKLATGKVVGVRRAAYPGGGPRNGHQSQ